MIDSRERGTVPERSTPPSVNSDPEIVSTDTVPDALKPLPIPGDELEVGLSQKGGGEDAIVRRETEI